MQFCKELINKKNESANRIYSLYPSVEVVRMTLEQGYNNSSPRLNDRRRRYADSCSFRSFSHFYRQEKHNAFV